MRKPARLVLMLAPLVLLTGCAKTIAAIASCDVGNHVSVSKSDTLTEQTAQEIDANNKSREAAGCAAKSDA